MIKLVRAEPSKADSPMLVTLVGTMVLMQPIISVLEAVSIMALQLFRLSYIALALSTTILVKPMHQEKADSPMLVTLLGIVTLVKPEQLAKASFPMLVTLLGISILVRPEQLKKAPYPMFVTLLGIVTLVKPEQP